jgi:hypothetical protein
MQQFSVYYSEKLLHQVGDLFELNVKLLCQKVKAVINDQSTRRYGISQMANIYQQICVSLRRMSEKFCSSLGKRL